MDSETLVYKLHGRLLRHMSDKVGVHFEGLAAAARHYSKKKRISTRSARRLRALDDTFNWMRHITTAISEKFVFDISEEIDGPDNKVVPHKLSTTTSSSPVVETTTIADPKEGLLALEKEVQELKVNISIPDAVNQYFKLTRGTMCSQVPGSLIDSFGGGDSAHQEAICRDLGSLLTENFTNNIAKQIGIPEADIARATDMVSTQSVAEARKMLMFWHGTRGSPDEHGEAMPKRQKLKAVTQR